MGFPGCQAALAGEMRSRKLLAADGTHLALHVLLQQLRLLLSLPGLPPDFLEMPRLALRILSAQPPKTLKILRYIHLPMKHHILKENCKV